MKRNITKVALAYTFDPTHKGAPYTLNGENWMNAGDLKECLYKASLGLKATKDASGRYDTTDDVPETGESVKSSKATLTSVVLGYDHESVKRHYFATVHSKAWVWVVLHDDELITYHMNREEFEAFVDEWARFMSDRKVVRFKADSTKMLKWLDERII